MFFQLKTRCKSLLFIVSIAIMINQSFADTKSETRISIDNTGKFIEWTYKDAPMGLYLPAATDKPLPVVMFLHGCHNDPVSEYHWIISALNEIEPCAVFLPTAPETQNTPYSCADWGGTYDSDLRPQMINALHELDSLIAFHGFDTKRQYLYGESMGGEGVYRLLMDFPTRFAGAVDAAGYTVNKGAANMAKTPLWILIGSDDEMSPVDSSRTIYNAILSAGGTLVKYTEYEGLTHVAGIEKAREEPGILQWLLTQNRSTGVILGAKVCKGSINSSDLLKISQGNLHISSQLPCGTIVTLFDLNGQVIFRTDTQRKSINLPTAIAGRTILWSASNSQFTISGKMSICQK